MERGSGADGDRALTFPFSDFGMTPPSIAGFVSVDDNATLEFSLDLVRG